MTYNTNLATLEQGAIAELYKVTAGDETFYYTSYINNIEFQSNEYIAVKIKRTTISNEPKIVAHRVKLSVPITQPFSRYIANTSLSSVNVVIYRAFVSDTTFEVIFEGRAINAITKLGGVDIDFESNSQIFRKKIGAISHQAFCNNGLYDERCSLSANDFKTTAQVTVTSNTLVAAVFDTFDDQYFRGGHVLTSYLDSRMITNHVGNTITLHVPFDSRTQTGAIVSVFAGCDKSTGSCRDKFNNFENFNGFPFIPSNNPSIFGV